ncbi:hypothetical protein I7V30_09645 [Lelliottia amnigena]|uniref:hypothetical protein n=1 Tax=Lelliottia amnigena TaxID=61646 RepID=UPI00192AF1B7|nr:hypothetical protein [Lelliottia amnigena]MBL5965526.1 hypothetical protein [Lelliottia amnigena]
MLPEADESCSDIPSSWLGGCYGPKKSFEGQCVGSLWPKPVSLCRTATWLQQQGSLNHWRSTDPMFAIRCIATETGSFGELQYFNTALELERTPLRFTSPVLPLGLRIPVRTD